MGGASDGPATWDDLLCFGYGILRLPPRELYRVTPGELFDMAVAHLWVNREQSGPPGPMDSDTRAQQLAKLERLMGSRG